MRVEARRDVVLHPRPYLLHTDQIRNDQVPLIDGDPGQRLGDGWLLSAPLRAIVINDDGLHHIASGGTRTARDSRATVGRS
jgi:hypothetical protein